MLELAKSIKKIVPGIVGERVFTFSIRDVSYYVICFDVEMDAEMVSLCFTASHGKNVYFSVTDGDPEKVSLLLAFFLDYEINDRYLDVGDTFKPDDEYLLSKGRKGVVFLPPKVLPLLSDIPTYLQVDDVEKKSLLSVFMDNKEFDIKDSQGMEGLLDYFSQTKKDMIRLDAADY